MNKKQLVSILVVVFIDLLGFSLILPLLPYYAETFRASPFVTGLLVAAYAAAQLIGAPVLGRLSDRYGRRPILLISVFGTFVGFILLGLATSLWILFASRILDGLTGGNLSIAQAYISDVTDARSRARGLGMVGAAFGLGFILGPAAGGLLSQGGYSVPAFVAAGLSLLNLGLIYFWLSESLPPERRGTLQGRPPVTLAALTTALRRPFTGSLLITRFFFGLAFAILQSIFSLYVLARFGLSASQTGYLLAYVGVIAVITQGFLVGRLSARVREDVLIVACAALMAVSLAGWALASSVPGLMLVLLPASFAGGMLNTLLNSTLTRAVETSEVGGILGLSTSVESSTRILAPIAGGALLQQVGAWGPGALSAVIMVGVFVFTLRTIYDHEIVHTLARSARQPLQAPE